MNLPWYITVPGLLMGAYLSWLLVLAVHIHIHEVPYRRANRMRAAAQATRPERVGSRG